MTSQLSDVHGDVLTPKDVCEKTGLSKGTVGKLLRTGQIPSRRAGRRYLISRANYEQWLNNVAE